MNPLRKIIGAFLIIFIGLPVLFAVVWTAGLTRAAVSPALISDVPRKIIDAVPDIAAEVLAAGRNPDVIDNPAARAWFEAAAKAGTTPRELLDKTGITSWMRGELTRALTEVGEVLRGDRTPRGITIDLRPLKKALLSPDVDDYILAVLKNLPPCGPDGLQAWTRAAESGMEHVELPACQPDPAIAQGALRLRHDRIVTGMRDEVEIMEDVHLPPMGITRSVTVLALGLFLIPAVFILGGAAIAARSREGFLKWSGASVLAGGLLSLGAAWFVRGSVELFFRWAPWSRGAEWSTGLGPLLLDKTRWAASLVLDKLFSPVMSVAGAVCAVGLILFAFSFVARPQAR